jgi:hypothetical protein
MLDGETSHATVAAKKSERSLLIAARGKPSNEPWGKWLFGEHFF